MARKPAKPSPAASDIDTTATTEATTSAPPTTTSTTASTSTTSTSISKHKLSTSSSQSGNPVVTVWNNYVSTTPARVKMIDVFMIYLIGVGVMQFVYCVIAGNYPFNAFLAGFSATVGQFVLTASLRIQTNPSNKGEFTQVSPERAFADFIFGSLVLHFFCVNFIN